MIKQIDHIGIAVHSLEKALPFFTEGLGLEASKVEEVPSQQVRVIALKVGEVSLELLEPTSKESPIAKFLEKRGEGLHHIAFGSDEIEAGLEKAKSFGCSLIHETPFEGADNKRVAFLHPRSTFGTLIEFCQRQQTE